MLAALLALAACSHGSRSAPPPVTPPTPTRPQKVAFTVELPAGSSGLDVTVAADGGSVDVTVPTVNLGGTIDTTNDDLVLQLGPQATAALAVAAPAVFPDLEIRFLESLVVPGNADHPTAGRLGVYFDTHELLILMDATTVTLDLDAGQQTAAMSWTDFEALDAFGTAPEFQRLGAFAFAAMEFTVEHMFRCIEGFDLIAVHENQLNSLGPSVPVVLAGDVYPPTMQAGRLEFAWHDTGEPLSAGQIGPGDGFTSTFVNCWRDDPTDDVDERFDGTIDYFDYHEIDSPFWRYFAEVRFTDFTVAETEETAPGVFEDGVTTTVNGSLTVQLAEG